MTRRAGDVNPPVTVRARVARTASGTHQGRYRPIDIDRSPWDVFCDSFGLGTDDSWGIEMYQFSCPHTVSPSQLRPPGTSSCQTFNAIGPWPRVPDRTAVLRPPSATRSCSAVAANRWRASHSTAGPSSGSFCGGSLLSHLAAFSAASGSVSGRTMRKPTPRASVKYQMLCGI